MRRKNLTLLCFDGADLDKIKEYAEEGQLPNFKQYLEDNRLGKLKSTIPSNTSPAAFCIYTGCNPAKNGPVAMKKRDNETPYNRSDLHTKQLWDYLDEMDIRFGVYDARFADPVPEKGEFFTSSYPKKDYHPASLEDELEEFDKHPEVMSVTDVKDLGDMHIRNINHLNQENLDFKFYYIGILDTIAHEHWNNDVLKEAYKQADKILGRIEELSENLILISDHGFHQSPEYNVHVNNLLEKKDLIKRSNISTYLDRIVPLVKRKVPDRILRPLWNQVRKRNSGADENDVENGGEDESFLSFEKRLPGIKWDETEAYCSTYFGIDVKSRDEKVKNQVIEELKQIEHKGRKVFKEVHKKEDIYDGEFINRIPEIIFVMNPKYRATHTFANNLITKKEKEEKGVHEYARYGIFGLNKELSYPENPTVYDITPTILAYYGYENPSLDGKILPLEDFEGLENIEALKIQNIQV